MRKIILIIFLALLAISCEDVIDVELNDGESQLTVDAILTNFEEDQIVRLTNSGEYFNPETVTPALNAEVSMVDSKGNQFTFEELGNGEYKLNESTLDFEVGTEFTLRINYEGESYSAISEIYRVPEIDSITWQKEEQILGDEDSIWVAQFWSTDLEGLGDAYWIRTFRNGIRNNDPGNIILAYDAAPGRGTDADAIPFTLPIRTSITPGGPGGPPSDEETLQIGESVGVSLKSISIEFAEYLTVLDEQLNSGGLFAPIPSNLPTNIINDNEGGKEALGWFAVCNTRKDSATITTERFNNRD